MYKTRGFRGTPSTLGLLFLLSTLASAQTTHRPELKALGSAVSPFADNNGDNPPNYHGPLFQLNAAWPRSALPPLQNPPWQAAIQGQPISVANAAAYTAALRNYVSKNAKNLIVNYDTWDASKAGWYNEPWLGRLREAIHGTYGAGEFGPAIFPGTGLRATFNTHVLTYYDERAAYSLYKLWGATAMKPDIETRNSQFDEGSVIVKAAVFASTELKSKTDWWDAMKGAQVWQLYVSPDGDPAQTQVWPGYVAQFDIIVKDSKSAPKTGWVFTTLVYDSSVPGDAWDKMIPLGAQWGNDPQATKPDQALVENWINPKAPKYSTQTLGWGGRLSGPNDGARNDIAVNGKVEKNAPDSSCMSCHSTAQWNVEQHKMVTFLLPSFAQNKPGSANAGFQLCGADGKPSAKGNIICSPAPASAAWMKWFQNRKGTQPMDPGSIAMDFDEVFSFKSLPEWWRAMHPVPPTLLEATTPVQRFNEYTGAPLPAAPGGK
jgi:hypothetical protein